MQERQFILNKDVVYRGNKIPKIELKRGTSLTLRQIDSVFKFGLWRFESENQLIFQPKSSLFPRLFPLTATYIKVGTAYQFRAERVLEFEQVFLDGVLQIKDKLLIIDAIYSLSTPAEPLQVARIIQSLEPSCISIDEFEEYRALAPDSSVELAESLPTIELEQLPLEIDPLPIIKNYSVRLAGNTESAAFNSLEASLFITFSLEDEERPNSIQLISKITSELQPGNLNWNCQSLEHFFNNDWYSKKENEANSQLINIQLELSENLPTTNCTWYSKAKNGFKANIVPVMGKNITVNLTIDGDLVEGNISASGHYLDNLNPSTYQATIVGEIEKSLQVEDLRRVLNSENANFTGCWLTDIATIGEITLQQHGNKVRGIYTPKEEQLEGTIKGIIQGNLLEFSWINGEQEGWGYFRSLNQGGTLSGMWGIGDFPSPAQAIIGNWQLPINVEAASQDDEILLRELRWLGHELIHQQRFEPGLTVLEEVLDLYRHQRHQLSISSQDELNYLQDEAFTLVGYVLRSNIYSGKYNKLLGNLDHLIEVIQLLGASESASRLFRERTASIKQSLIDFKQNCQLFIEGLERNKHLLNSESSQGKIGIFLEQEASPRNIVVSKVLKDSSAELAGILTGDILLRVGETNAQGISLEEVYNLLVGEPNSVIDVSVQREDKKLMFSLIRQPVQVYPLHQKAELLSNFNYLTKYFVNLANLTEIELDNLERLNLQIAQGQIDFIEAWIVLQNYLTLLGAKNNQSVEELLELKEKIFIEYPSFLENVNLALSFLSQLSFNLKNKSNSSYSSLNTGAIEPIELDRKIESFLSDNTTLSQLESILFRCYLHSFQTVNGFYLEIELQHDFMSKIDIVKNFAENQQRSQTMLSNLTHYIEKWRSKLVDDLEKIDALEQAQPLFTKILEISVALGDAKEALIFSEKSRARAFADMLATRFNRDVRQDLSSFPVNSPEITFEQIVELAQTNCATIVEYFVAAQEEAEAKIYIWAIQPSGSTLFKTVELNSGSQQQNSFLSNLIIKARESFGVKHSQTIGNNLERSLAKTKDSFSLGSSRELEQSQTLLAELYQLLIEPIESCLNTSSANKVILIPHGTLFLIPFATLLNSQTNQYLVEQYSIILAPSLQTLNLTQQNFVRDSEAQNVLVIGNPQMPSFGEPPQQRAQLPYAETAARAISNLFKTKPLVGKQATKLEITTQLPNAKIIHFGTHGEFNDSQPLESGIALAPEGDEGGFLTVGDILARFAPPQTLSLNAELVVLSACSTGLGKITGDGVIGLARGLMAAGVKGVLVSLWEVQDFPTACLMVQFYQYLQVGNTPHEALKQAQVWLKDLTNDELKEWMRREKLPLKSMEKQNLMNWLRQEQQQGNSHPFQHPYYWGAFYLIGS